MQDGTKLFVGGIPIANATEEGVSELFAEAGGCFPLEVVLLPPKGTNHETRCGFVRIPSEMVDQTCQAMNGLRFEGAQMALAVRVADNQGVKPAGQSVPPGHTPTHVPARVVPSSAGGLDGAYVQDPFVGGSAASGKAQAKAAGRWLEAAELMEQEYTSAGETFEAKVERLRRALIAAAVEEHFYEAASLEEALNQLDPQAAAAANAAAAAASARRGNVTVAPAVNAHAAAANAVMRAKMATTVSPPQWAPAPARTVAPSVASPAFSSEEDFVGTILSYRAEKHFGFIQCAELGQDAFVSSHQINGFSVGDQVMFNVTFNNQGKPQAQNLRAPDGSLEEPASKRSKLF